MKKLILVAAIMTVGVFAASIFAAKPSQDEVLKKYFKECSDHTIGATSGATCRFDPATKDWHITYWGNGSGDCVAGCIQRDEFASYLVEADGTIHEGDSKKGRVVKPEDINKSDLRNVPVSAPAVNPDDKLACKKTEDCFWNQCCQASPMGKAYRAKHWQEAHLHSATSDFCDLKCMHMPPAKDQKLACVNLQCLAVAKDTPEIDPARPVVWIGTVQALPQCEEQYIKDNFWGNPTIIKKEREPGVAAGPKFSQWAADREKQMMDKNPNKFTCKACDICYHINHQYLLIYESDLANFQKSGWQRVDE